MPGYEKWDLEQKRNTCATITTTTTITITTITITVKENQTKWPNQKNGHFINSLGDPEQKSLESDLFHPFSFLFTFCSYDVRYLVAPDDGHEKILPKDIFEISIATWFLLYLYSTWFLPLDSWPSGDQHVAYLLSLSDVNEPWGHRRS